MFFFSAKIPFVCNNKNIKYGLGHDNRRCAYGAWLTSFPIIAAVAQFVTLQNTPFLYLGETVVYFIQYQLFAT